MEKDPAVERWAAMREHTHFYYRFNFRKLIPTAVMLGLIPAGIVYFSMKSFVRPISNVTVVYKLNFRITMRKFAILKRVKNCGDHKIEVLKINSKLIIKGNKLFTIGKL